MIVSVRGCLSLLSLLVRQTARCGCPSRWPSSTHDFGPRLTRDARRRTSRSSQTETPPSAPIARIAALAATVLFVPAALAQGSFGPYVPTPTVIVERLLDLGEVRNSDYLIDLGSGDGRIVITAAKKYGARGHGIDIQEKLVALAAQNARAEGVADRVHFVRGDLFEADLSQASVVTLYLLPNTIVKLVPKLLAELKPGSRVLSHDYPLKPWLHERYISFDLEEKKKISGTTLTVLYLYIVPAQVGGVWELSLPQPIAPQRSVALRIDQRADSLFGRASIEGATVELKDFQVRGEEVSFVLPRPGSAALVLRGKARGGEIAGVVDTPSGPRAWSARRSGGPTR